MTTDTVAFASQRRVMPQVVMLGSMSTRTEIAAPTSQRQMQQRPPYPIDHAELSGCFAPTKTWPGARCPGSLGTLGPGGRSIVIEAARSATPTSLALGEFTARVGAIAEVAAIAHAVEGDVQRVWTFVTRRDKAVRRRIYLEELALLEEHPDLQFDFNVVSIEEAPARGLVPDDLQGRIVFYRDDRMRRPTTTDA